jgi:hypothetical protein
MSLYDLSVWKYVRHRLVYYHALFHIDVQCGIDVLWVREDCFAECNGWWSGNLLCRRLPHLMLIRFLSILAPFCSLRAGIK